MDSGKDGILVLGAYRQTLSVLRSLGDAYALVLGCSDDESFVTKSRYVSAVWEHPALSDAESFLAGLQQLLRDRPEIKSIFPVGDTEILFLCQHADRLPEGITCVMPTVDVVNACQQKTEMFQRVCRLDIPAARYKSLTDGARSLLAAADEVGYPCIIKPENESTRVFGSKAYIALTQQALADKVSQANAATDLPGDLIVQKYCVGGRRNIYFFADHGRVLASVEVAIDRTDQLDGTGYAVEGHTVAPNKDWSRHLSRLVESLDYHGAGCLQYLVDPTTGESTFLEINARLGANFACVLDCGLDLPRWWIQLSEGIDRSRIGLSSLDHDFSYQVGRRYTWLYGDLLGLKKSVAAGKLSASQIVQWLSRLLLANFRSATHVTFRWSDPRPTITVFTELLSGPLKRLYHRVFRASRREAVADSVLVRSRANEYVKS